jgi:hypothetical protein
MLFFSLRDPTRASLPLTLREASPAAADFVTGGLLGAAISTAMYPFSVAKCAMQARAGPRHHPFRNVFAVIHQLFLERGLVGVYRGVGTNFVRSALSWSIMNLTYACVRRQFCN